MSVDHTEFERRSQDLHTRMEGITARAVLQMPPEVRAATTVDDVVRSILVVTERPDMLE